MRGREHEAKVLEAAVAYAGRGLPVFPCNGKKPHTEHGFQDASTDSEQVLAWWKCWPEANIGIRTGLDSLLVVLDVDVQHGGGGTLAELVKRHGELPAAPEVLTGGGGKHFYFAHPGREIRNSAGRLGQGLDVRGEGGYVIAPPSVHENGRAYKWTRPLGPPPPMPAWLLDDAHVRTNGAAPPVADVIPVGRRRQELLSLAGTFRRRGLGAEEILTTLTAVNERRCEVPLTGRELEELARDVAARYSPTVGEHDAELPPLRVVPLELFAAVDEPSAEPLLGSKQDTVLSAGGALVFYGDGGAGKTTLELDLVLHLAAGLPWLGLPVPRPCRVLVIENEGPRGRFRVKLREKLESWAGPPVAERIHVLEEPWALFTFANEGHRRELRALLETLEIDVLAAGPVQRLGIQGGGTPEEVSAFIYNLELVRAELERPVAAMFAHHENKAGAVSGAWEGVPDTLAHVQARGNGASRLFWQKARWSSTLHGKAWTLLWREGESFELDETPEVSDDDIVESILTAVREAPGSGWNTIDGLVKGKGTRKRELRDELLASGDIVNVGAGQKFALHVADDPVVRQLRPAGDAVGTQFEIGTGFSGETATASRVPPIRGRSTRDAVTGNPAGGEK
jgi:hypothetical protein